MIHSRFFIKIAFASAFVTGCLSNEAEFVGGTGNPVAVSLKIISGEDTRSALVSDDGIVENFVLAWYSGGTLEGTCSASSGEYTLRILPGTYNFHLVANMPGYTFPQSEGDLPSMGWSLPSPDMLGRIPMAGSIPGRRVSEGAVLVFPVERLCCRLLFSVKQNFSYGSFVANSFAIRHAAVRTLPFGGPYNASGDSVTDLDYASPVDLQSLNSGGQVALYTFENAMGTCPEVTSPDRKIPSVLQEFNPLTASKATYMELSGTWSATGVRTDVTYRIYLGADNTSDFNLLRGRTYRITLNLNSYPSAIGDDGSSIWRIEVDDYHDSRQLRFGTDTLNVNCGGGIATTVVNSNYGDLAYCLLPAEGCNFSSYGVSFSTDGTQWSGFCIDRSGQQNLFIKCDGHYPGVLAMRATTYDGAVSDTLNIRLVPEYVPYVVYSYFWDYDEDQRGYVLVNRTEESIRIRLASEYADDIFPCSFKFGGSYAALTPEFVTEYKEVHYGDVQTFSANPPVDWGALKNALDRISGLTVSVKVAGEVRTYSWNELKSK